MALNPADGATCNRMVEVIQATLHMHDETRRAAEAHLVGVEATAGFSQVVLKVVETATLPEPVRQAASVVFKNFVKRCWFFDLEDGVASKIVDADRAHIKARLVTLMCQVPDTVQRQLSESLTIISKTDFPHQWPTLLPELVSKLASPDMAIINGVLEAANSIFKRFRNVEGTEETCIALKAALDVFAAPLLEMFTKMTAAVDANVNNKAVLVPLFTALRTMARIFYSLNWITIPEFFEDHQKEWMTMFRHFLTYKNAILEDKDEEEHTGPIEALQAAILENIAVYAEKYDDEFREFFPAVVGAVWNLLVGWGPAGTLPKYDLIIATAMRFLSGVVGREMHTDVFKSPDTLKSICINVAIPNMRPRETEVELFEDNPSDYILRDVEGSNSDTRRRAAEDLIKGLCKNFDDQVSGLCMEALKGLMENYSRDRVNNWKDKDAAITLLLAVTVRAETRARGVSATNPKVNVLDACKAFILPELAGADVNELPMLKATCLKFIMTFRNQLDAPTLVALVPHLVRFLTSKFVVVHSYAAMALDRMMSVRLPGSAAVPPEVLSANLGPTVGNMLTIMVKPDYKENEYLMRTLMRAVSTGGPAMLPLAGPVLTQLTAILGRVTANPAHPRFNHYLFETLAALLTTVCKASPSPDTVNKFEGLLFPPFQAVLSKEVAEFLPYVFQILALLLDLRPPEGPGKEVPLSPAYQALLKAMMQPKLWDARGNVPALVQLLLVYLHRSGKQVLAGGQLVPLLGVFQRLVAARSSEDLAFKLLGAVVCHLELKDFQAHLQNLYRVLGERMQRNKTTRYAKSFVSFLALVSAKHGSSAVTGPLDALGSGTAMNIFNRIMVPQVPTITGRLRRKATVIGMSRLLTETPGMFDAADVWNGAIAAVVQLVEGKEVAEAEPQDIDAQIEQTLEYNSSFSQLAMAVIPPVDSFESVADARLFLAKQLADMSRKRPGTMAPRLAAIPGGVAPKIEACMRAAGVALA